MKFRPRLGVWAILGLVQLSLIGKTIFFIIPNTSHSEPKLKNSIWKFFGGKTEPILYSAK